MLAKYTERVRESVYRIYVTDTLHLYLTENKALQKRYADIVQYGQEPEPEDNRTAEEIAEDIIKRHGLKRKEDES